jgi:hypothetical protein
MDHFNAMLEDHSTGSWWRQATGEAIAGPLKGQQLQELYSTQSLLSEWLHMHPQSLVMQEDPAYKNDYDTSFNYESGRSRKQLTGTDSLSWKAKSWVIGVKAGNAKKAYDWNRLVKDRIINDQLDNIPLVLVLAGDNKSFFAYERPAKNFTFLMRNDTLFCQGNRYTLGGKAIDTGADLKPLPAYQEFWHSWRTFNPGSLH